MDAFVRHAAMVSNATIGGGELVTIRKGMF